MGNENRIYQLSNDQLNVISSDLIEAIILISGTKDKNGLLDELNNINGNLVDYLTQNKNIIDDLSVLFDKVKADDKLKLKIKEIEINQIRENDLILKIDELKKASDSYSKINNNISVELLKNSDEIKNKAVAFVRLLNRKESEVIKKDLNLKKDLEDKIDELKDFKAFNNKFFMISVFLTGLFFGGIITLSLLFTRLEARELFFLFQKVF
ncbi:hypothetical protein ACOTVL_10650 [Aliarcobacter butzleri]